MLRVNERICPVCRGILNLNDNPHVIEYHFKRNKYYDIQCYKNKISESLRNEYRKMKFYNWDEDFIEEFTKNYILERLKNRDISIIHD